MTSQIGQDGILKAIFEIIQPKSRFCVEFGAWDGKVLSNTWRLIAQENWSGILAEANKAKFDLIALNHPYERLKAVNQLITWEGDLSFDNTMKRHDAPINIDLVSIDIDGNDWHVWKSIEVFRPRVILIEFNATIPNDISFVQDADPSLNFGNSLRAHIELGKSKGYSLVCVDQWDAFFVLDEYYSLFGIEDNSIDTMFFAPQVQTIIFQGYDGSLFTTGNRTLLWSNITFDEDELQILPKRSRVYGDRPA